ncbi:10755_t:CDS:1 [Ambispora leptoticha]|uniref:10755_t:CDS:1 n=1 Tax=Ambispora leptoticha TaxID=144679 RepID=A0A9N9B645_9GLOM|nr:10755_t:CDS:1 [Ambispora leptoticha]
MFKPSYPPYLQTAYFLKMKRDGTRQKRAPNAFLVFRACVVAELKGLNFQLGGAAEFSHFASYLWRLLPEHEKKAYFLISSELKEAYSSRLPKRQFGRQPHRQNELNHRRDVRSKQQRQNYQYSGILGEQNKADQISDQFRNNLGERRRTESDQMFIHKFGAILREQQQNESVQISNHQFGDTLGMPSQQNEFFQIFNPQFSDFLKAQQQNRSDQISNPQFGDILEEQHQQNELYQILHQQFDDFLVAQQQNGSGQISNLQFGDIPGVQHQQYQIPQFEDLLEE